MCGRYTLSDPSPLMRRFGLEEFAETGITPRFNIAPSQLVPIIMDTARGPEMRLARWGFVPPWLKAPMKSPPPINARAETLTERPLFRGALRYQRCLIPADGFYEWKTIEGTKRKQPMYIHLKDGALFGFAGLYADAPADNPAEGTFAIITTEPNVLMAQIHNRMPVIVEPAEESLWLDHRENRSEEVLRILRQYPADQMEAFPVSTLVNAPSVDSPELILPESNQQSLV
ncbi:MAG: SOS response-associated peptidase [Chloroflexota bacterium]